MTLKIIQYFTLMKSFSFYTTDSLFLLQIDTLYVIFNLHLELPFVALYYTTNFRKRNSKYLTILKIKIKRSRLFLLKPIKSIVLIQSAT